MLVIAAAILVAALAAPRAEAAFGVAEWNADVFDASGEIYTQAGGHPYTGVTDFTMNRLPSGATDGSVKNVRVDLPPGIISNPEAVPKCTDAQYNAQLCPPETQLGTEQALVREGPLDLGFKVPIYNMVPPPGRVSVFAFGVPGVAPRTDILGGVRTASPLGDYGLFFEIFNIAPSPAIIRSKLTFWGTPASSQHTAERGEICTPPPLMPTGPLICAGGGKPSTAEPVPFITNPTVCDEKKKTYLTVESQTGEKAMAVAETPVKPSNCDAVPFAPSMAVTPATTKRDSPTGFGVKLSTPQSLEPDELGTAHVKDATVTLPSGLTLNPSAANGLDSCSDEQFDKPSAASPACPAASKVGTASIASHTIPSPLTGAVYVGRPVDGNRFRIFVHVAAHGVTVKLEGKVTPDPATGQLTTTFADNPQLPFTDFVLNFDSGSRAVVATPLACGEARSTSALAPYSGTPALTPSSAFTVDGDGAGAPCAPTPFALGFSAATASPLAGAFSPFTLDLGRDDGHQYLSRISLRQPPGLLGVLRGVQRCGEADAARGSCPAASRIGTATTGAGAGSEPFVLSGPVSITGPYKGAPFGLSVAIRAIAGPYDLGTVVVRAAIRVDPVDAHLEIDSDPLPAILEGVPLRLRTIKVAIDRERFIFNPTNCSPMSIRGTLTSVDGTVQQTSSPFQATGCDKLAFTPKLRAVGSSKASLNGAALSVTLTQPPGQSNIRSVAVQLPIELATNGKTLARACVLAVYSAGPAGCPAVSRVGTATAVTPVLDEPLRGTAYLVARGNKLPSLEVVLEGEGVTVRLSGTTTITGRIKSTFETIPDVPVTSFKIDLPSSPNSALATRKNLCAKPLTLDTVMVAQNGASKNEKIPLEIDDCTLRVVKRSYNRRKGTATLTIQSPSAGKVTISGKYLRTVRRTIRSAGHTKVTVALSKRGVAALRRKRSINAKSRRKLQITATVRLAAAKPAAGAKKVAAPTTKIRTKLTFR